MGEALWDAPSCPASPRPGPQPFGAFGKRCGCPPALGQPPQTRSPTSLPAVQGSDPQAGDRGSSGTCPGPLSKQIGSRLQSRLLPKPTVFPLCPEPPTGAACGVALSGSGGRAELPRGASGSRSPPHAESRKCFCVCTCSRRQHPCPQVWLSHLAQVAP